MTTTTAAQKVKSKHCSTSHYNLTKPWIIITGCVGTLNRWRRQRDLTEFYSSNVRGFELQTVVIAFAKGKSQVTIFWDSRKGHMT